MVSPLFIYIYSKKKHEKGRALIIWAGIQINQMSVFPFTIAESK